MDAVRELLAQSLAAWRIAGEAARQSDDTLLLVAGKAQIVVAPAPTSAGLPFRWMVTIGERTRGVTGIPGLLRTVRATVDPSYRPVRLRIAPSPLVPP
jgi:hypothetical protein